jgi:hypothetical protein
MTPREIDHLLVEKLVCTPKVHPTIMTFQT